MDWIKKNKGISIGVAVAVLFIVGISTTETPSEEQVNKESNETVASEQEQQSFDLSKIDYTVGEAEDLSIGGAKRLSKKIVIRENSVTEEMMKAVAEEQVAQLDESVDALSMLFYFDESQVDGAATLGKIDYAPNGNWSDAGEDTEKQYSYDFYDIVGETRTNAPTALEREINDAMKDLWYEKAEETDELVTDEDIAKILAPKYDKTVEEMLEIRQRVSNYDLGIQ